MSKAFHHRDSSSKETISAQRSEVKAGSGAIFLHERGRLDDPPIRNSGSAFPKSSKKDHSKSSVDLNVVKTVVTTLRPSKVVVGIPALWTPQKKDRFLVPQNVT